MRRRLSFSATTRAPRQARRAVRDALTRAGHVDQADTAEVLTSELVTNAVRHADGDPVGVEVQADGMVRVAVADDTQALPVLQHAGQSDTQGRGIAMVNELARRWGVELRAGGGKVVWFELSARRATAVANRVRAAARLGATATSTLLARVRKSSKTLGRTGKN